MKRYLLILCTCMTLLLTSCTSIINGVMQRELGYTNAQVKELKVTPDPETKLTTTSALLVGGVTQYMMADSNPTVEQEQLIAAEMEIAATPSPGLEKFMGPEEIGKKETYTIPVEGGTIQVTCVWPKKYEKLKGSLPVVFVAHGGSFTGGDYDQYSRFMSIMANDLKAIFVFPEYRLAPLYKFPTAPNDIYAAWNWMLENADMLNIDTSRTAVIGDSAGGNLAAGLSIRLYMEHQEQPGSVVLMYPNLTLTSTYYPSRIYFSGIDGKNYFIDSRVMQEVADSYLQTPEQATAPYASPLIMLQGLVQFAGVENELAPYALKATPPIKLAPTLVIVAQADSLRDEAIVYGAVLKYLGTETTTTVYKGMLHGFPMFDMLFPEGKKAIQESVSYISKYWK